MKISPRRRRRQGIGAAVALAAIASTVPPSAYAESGSHPSYATGDTVLGPLPEEALDDFASCPTADQFPPILDESGAVIGHHAPEWCLKITAYDGEIKLGNTVAHVEDPIEIVIAVNSAGVIVPASTDGDGPTPIKISGGILGVPELDPLLDATLGLLSVSATPQIGEVGVGRHDQVVDPDTPPALTPGAQFLGWLFNGTPWHGGDVVLNVPLSIKLNNTLFGKRCAIDEFNINLTTGITEPPTGIEPMSGDAVGDFRHTRYNLDGHESGFWMGPWVQFNSRVGARFVDNTFSVPNAARCDLLLGDLLGQDAGLFDGLIGGLTGLPGKAGRNHATFSIDTLYMPYRDALVGMNVSPSSINGLGGTVMTPLDFGGPVTVGDSATQVITITSTGTHPLMESVPLTITGSAANAAQYEIVSNSCGYPALVEAGEQCEIEVRFTPTSEGTKSAGITTRLASGGNYSHPLRGVGAIS